VKPYFKLTALTAAVALSACSVLESDKVDYRGTAKAPELSIPPDLTQLSKDTRYTMVDGGVSASSRKDAKGIADSTTGALPVAAASVADIRIQRNGNQRWLVIKRKPEALWDPIKDFWLENGFLLTIEQKNVGIMETEWAENRAKLPQDIIRATIGKAIDALYSTPERDKYRTRLEVNSDGETEVYISHRGMVEVYVAERRDETMWQPRPTDPELEVEFLRRLMIRLGYTEEQAKTQLADAAPKQLSTIATVNARPVLRISENFDRAWRRIGLSLDRTGFTVEDRDRNRGIYFVRYVGAEPIEPKPNFFARLFSSSPKAPEAARYQIVVTTEGDSTVVGVQDNKGTPDATPTAQRIVKVLADDIR